MKQVKPLDKGKAICENCEKLVTTTYLYKDVPCNNGNVVENILMGVCDECNSVVSLPHQEVGKIKTNIGVNNEQ